MDPATISLIASLSGSGVQAVGAGISAYAQSQQADADRAFQQAQWKDSTNFRDQQYSDDQKVQKRKEPLDTLSALLSLRQGIGQPTSTDVLRSLSSSYG